MARLRPLTCVLLMALLPATACFPEPYPHDNPDDPDYSGTASEAPTPTATLPVDADGDGESASTDCDDNNAAVNHAAAEIAYDGVDNDCEGGDLTDVDGDGVDASQVGGDDCDDNNASINPAADDLCNGIDDDCSGTADDDTSQQTVYYLDGDEDGFGAGAVLRACDPPSGSASERGDCDDTDAGINPDALEICDGQDQDCDENVDEGVLTPWYEDSDLDGFGGDVSISACDAPEGYIATTGDCDDSAATTYPNAEEVCDDADQDCDGLIDEGVLSTFYPDTDGDSFGDGGAPVFACSQPSDTTEAAGDCDDNNSAVSPAVSEICDGVDNNCDGTLDEGVTETFFTDADLDGYGDTELPKQACEATEGLSALQGDCDDEDASVYPDAAEACADQVDSNCDGSDDPVDDSSCTDDDGDGYIESPPPGVEADCDDENAAVYPGAVEVYNDVDDNCDGRVDEGTQNYDDDGDSFSELRGDCDDSDPAINPDAQEQCDEIDHDCDGVAGVGDADGVGGDDCTDDDGDGVAEIDGDCDDEDAEINPQAEEIANTLDDNCDGLVNNDLDLSSEAGFGTNGLYLLADHTVVGSAIFSRPGDSVFGPTTLVRAVNTSGQVLLYSQDDFKSGGPRALKTDSYISAPAGSGVGEAVVFGDLNGDTLIDTVVGAPGLGRVCIFFGSISRASSQRSLSDAESCVFAQSTTDGLGAAHRIAVSDLNDDGYDDLILGAPGVVTSETQTGEVLVFSGGSVWGSTLLTSDATASIAADGQLEQGAVLAVVGDLDRNGLDDFAYTSRPADDASMELHVIYPTSVDISRSEPNAGQSYAEITFTTAMEIAQIFDVGDVYGDGLEDLMVLATDDISSDSALLLVEGGDERLDLTNTRTQSLSAQTDAYVVYAGLGAYIGVAASQTSGWLDLATRLLVTVPDAPTDAESNGAGRVYIAATRDRFGSPLLVPGSALESAAEASWTTSEAGAALGSAAIFAVSDNIEGPLMIVGAPGAGSGEGAVYIIADVPPFPVF